MEKKAYHLRYPSAARFLIEEGVTAAPRQKERTFKWSEGIDIIYTLRGMTPANFKKYSDSLLLLAYQEAMRYNEYHWKFAGFEVKLGRLPKGKDLSEMLTFQAAMHNEPDIMVYGEGALGYEVPEGQKKFLTNKVDDILSITKRYPTKVNKQNPYKVVQLVISIREELKK